MRSLTGSNARSSGATVSPIHFSVASSICMGMFSNILKVGELLPKRQRTVPPSRSYSKTMSYTSSRAFR